uniref:Uncharacterized protein n=1 Tax=Arundo donax TaxID=35708 RepID=A0A0A9G1H6_ARUDO
MWKATQSAQRPRERPL